MAQKSGDGTIQLGTEAWNVADGFVKLKVLKQLVLCDKLEMISLYGYEDIDEEGFLPDNFVNYRRVNAINRLKDNIKQLISNVKFAIKSEDLWKFNLLRGRVKTVEELLIDVSYITVDQSSHQNTLTINEDWFVIMLNELQEIKESIHVPINNAGLIFRSDQVMDFDDILKDIVEGG